MTARATVQRRTMCATLQPSEPFLDRPSACMRGGREYMPEIVDIIFEVVFPEISAHVPRVTRSDPKLLQVTPRLNLLGRSVLKGAGCEAEDDSEDGARDSNGQGVLLRLANASVACNVSFLSSRFARWQDYRGCIVKVRRWRIAFVKSIVDETTQEIWMRLLDCGGEGATASRWCLRRGVRRWLSMTKGASRGEFAL
jgi:hypothetical protein